MIGGVDEQAERLFERGELDGAERLCKRALALNARSPRALHVLGMIAYRRGDFEGAAKYMRRSLAIDRRNALYHSNLGGVLRAQSKPREAVVRYASALAIEPDMAVAHYNLGNAQRDLGLPAEAIVSYNLAISLMPNLAQAHNNLADMLRLQGKIAEAIAGYRRAIGCRPELSEAYTNLGAMLQFENLLDGSLACHRRAVALAPNLAEAHYNLGSILFDMGDAKAAQASYKRAIELKPECADARFGSSLVYLLKGDLASGWKEYGSRWQSTHFDTRWRDYPQPVWTGDRIGSGKVLLWREQGVGDEIMFASLIPDLLRRRIRCVVDCDRRLMPLLSRSFPEVQVVSSDAPAFPNRDGPAFPNLDEKIAAHLPLGSLPEIVRPDVASFAETPSPYLFADPSTRDEFRARYGASRYRIGLAWHTRNKSTGKRRSIELRALASIFNDASAEMHVISLQYGDHEAIEAEVKAAGSRITLDRSVDQLGDMDRFAAQIAALDLVITIDNSTAHLAGALGVKTWVLLPFAADWRWMEGRDDSPWYPTVRLFRQPRAGDWQSVLVKVREALTGFTLRR